MFYDPKTTTMPNNAPKMSKKKRAKIAQKIAKIIKNCTKKHPKFYSNNFVS